MIGKTWVLQVGHSSGLSLCQHTGIITLLEDLFMPFNVEIPLCVREMCSPYFLNASDVQREECRNDSSFEVIKQIKDQLGNLKYQEMTLMGAKALKILTCLNFGKIENGNAPSSRYWD